MNLLSTKQHGFMKGRSAVTQLSSYMDTRAQSMASGNVIDVIFFDFVNAFDAVFHRRKSLNTMVSTTQFCDELRLSLLVVHSWSKSTEKDQKTVKYKAEFHKEVFFGRCSLSYILTIYQRVVKSILYLFVDDTKLL